MNRKTSKPTGSGRAGRKEGYMVETKIRQLFQIIDELRSKYPEKRFTLDGDLLGDLGEVYAEEHYSLHLLRGSNETHDAITEDGKLVQIKITQINRVGIYSEPDYLLVFQVQQDGTIIEIYNGPGREPWECAGKLQKNGQRQISIARLRQLEVEAHDCIERIN